WLNDVVINTYLENAAQRANDKVGRLKSQPAPFYALSSHWLTTFNNKGPAEVAKWLKRRPKIMGNDFYKCEVLLLPVNTGAHWTLLAISGTKRTVQYYDSMRVGGAQSKLENAHALLREIIGPGYNVNEWSFSIQNSSQQSNGNDCGVFTSINGLCLLRGLKPTDQFTYRDIPDLRKQMALTLMKGSFKDEF
ncbi:cysteine proteinase, partial [Aulographum hederae CBS 113979]